MKKLMMRKLMTWIVLAGVSISLSAAASTGSLYDAKLKFTDDTGAPVELSKWKGETVVITMAYTSCTHTCPMILRKLGQIRDLYHGQGKKPKFVIATFDPEHDTAAALAEYRKKSSNLDKDWTFVTAPQPVTRKLSMLLGIKYRINAESGDIMHDNKILVLDETGKIRHSLMGLDADISVLAK